MPCIRGRAYSFRQQPDLGDPQAARLQAGLSGSGGEWGVQLSCQALVRAAPQLGPDRLPAWEAWSAW